VIRPLPFHQPGQLVEIYNSFPKVGMPNAGRATSANIWTFKDNAPAFAQLALWRLDDYTLGEDRGPSRISGAIATAEIFDLLGATLARPVLYSRKITFRAPNKVVVLTRSFWESQFQSNPSILGRMLRLDGEPIRDHRSCAPRLRGVRPPGSGWPAPCHGRQVSRSATQVIHPNFSAGSNPARIWATPVHRSKHWISSIYDGTTPENREFYERTGHRIRVDTVAVAAG